MQLAFLFLQLQMQMQMRETHSMDFVEGSKSEEEPRINGRAGANGLLKVGRNRGIGSQSAEPVFDIECYAYLWQAYDI